MYQRRLVLTGGAVALAIAPFPFPALAAGIAEDFITTNIHVGFDILNDSALNASERKKRFAALLIGLTDVRRVALFLLGRFALGTRSQDLDAYVAVYQDYILAVYQSYFSRYAGQSLRVLTSRERSPGDFVVRTSVTGSAADARHEIDFRVLTEGGKPVLMDLGVDGLWLAVAQREEFAAVLARSNGDLKTLTAHLRTALSRFAT